MKVYRAEVEGVDILACHARGSGCESRQSCHKFKKEMDGHALYKKLGHIYMCVPEVGEHVRKFSYAGSSPVTHNHRGMV